MARKPKHAAALVNAAEEAVKSARCARELREAQAVLLPALHGLSLAQTGRLIGRSRASVTRLRSEFKGQVEEPHRPQPQWGGRRRQNMSPEEEAAFLQPFLAEAARGRNLVVASLKAAYERALGRGVPDSTVYRLLARHGWRKSAPRPRLPRPIPSARQAGKKLPETLSALWAERADGRKLRLMFQDERRFGRMSDPRRCGGPPPLRPAVQAALVREHLYVYPAGFPGVA